MAPQFRDQVVLTTSAGADLAAALIKHSAELAQLLAADQTLRDQAADLLAAVESAASHGRALDAELVGRARQLAGELSARGSPELRDALAAAIRDAEHFRGKTIPDALRAKASEAEERSPADSS